MKIKQESLILTIVTTLVSGIASVGVASTAAQAAPAATGGRTVSGVAEVSSEVFRTIRGSGTEARSQALAAYWTPERMTAARPVTELPSVRAAALTRSTVGGAASGPQGASQRIAGVAPKTEPRAFQRGASTPQSDVSTQAAPANFPVGHPTARTIGKIFFTAFGQNFTCSGTIVNTEGKSAVWTAGNCVANGGVFNTNWIFVPNYASGSIPFGIWSAAQLTTTAAYMSNNSDFANNIGVAIVNRTFGVRIADYLGAQGITWNGPAGGNLVWSFGYPFDGCCLFVETGVTTNAGDGSIYITTAMTPEAGPWLVGYDGNFGLINGHNGFKYAFAPQLMFSAYYGNQVAALYNSIRFITT